MKLIEIDWNPSQKQLRQFGWIGLVAFPLAGWAFGRWHLPADWSVGYSRTMMALSLLGGVCGGLAAFKPAWLKPIFLGMTLLAFPIGWVVSQLAIGIIYFLVITPVSLFFRLIGRDALDRRLEPKRSSYWQPKRQPSDVRQYFRQS